MSGTARTAPQRLSLSAALFAICVLPAPAAASVQSVPSLGVDQWREDLEVYAARMPEVHENLYHTISETQFREAVDDLERRLPELEDHEVIVELARITAMIGDGHTRLWLTPNSRNGFHQVPILLYWLEDGLYVLGAPEADTAALGGKVVRIGNSDVDEAWKRVIGLVPRDNEMTVRSIAPRYLEIPEVLDALGITESLDRVRYVVRDDQGTEHVVELDAIPDAYLSNLSNMPYLATTPSDRIRLVMANEAGGEPPLWLQHPDRTFWYYWLPEKRTFYIQLNAVRNTDEESLSAFFERAYGEMDRLGAERLVARSATQRGREQHAESPGGTRDRPAARAGSARRRARADRAPHLLGRLPPHHLSRAAHERCVRRRTHRRFAEPLRRCLGRGPAQFQPAGGRVDHLLAEQPAQGVRIP